MRKPLKEPAGRVFTSKLVLNQALPAPRARTLLGSTTPVRTGKLPKTPVVAPKATVAWLTRARMWTRCEAPAGSVKGPSVRSICMPRAQAGRPEGLLGSRLSALCTRATWVGAEVEGSPSRCWSESVWAGSTAAGVPEKISAGWRPALRLAASACLAWSRDSGFCAGPACQPAVMLASDSAIWLDVMEHLRPIECGSRFRHGVSYSTEEEQGKGERAGVRRHQECVCRE